MPEQQAAQDRTYTVRPGDTLSEIADMFGIQGGYQVLVRHNGIRNPNAISPGQKIKIPGGGSSNAGGQNTGGGRSGGGNRTYTIRRGDTLAGIAARFNYPGGYQALARANGISNPARIFPGQTIQVGSGGAGTGGGQQGGGQNQAPASEPEQDGPTGRQDGPIHGEGSWISAAVRYNQRRGYGRATWRQFQEKMGTPADGVPGRMTARAVYRWQQSHNLTMDGQLGPQTARSLGHSGGGAGAGGGGGDGGGGGGGGGSATGLRRRILDIAHSTLTSRTGHNYYRQPGATTYNPLAKYPNRSDCSQWVRAVYKQAGANGEPGTYTGAMVGRSRRTNNPTPGDIMLKDGHVELYIGNGETIGHGSEPINKGSVSYWRGRGMWFATYDFLNR